MKHFFQYLPYKTSHRPESLLDYLNIHLEFICLMVLMMVWQKKPAINERILQWTFHEVTLLVHGFQLWPVVVMKWSGLFYIFSPKAYQNVLRGRIEKEWHNLRNSTGLFAWLSTDEFGVSKSTSFGAFLRRLKLIHNWIYIFKGINIVLYILITFTRSS